MQYKVEAKFKSDYLQAAFSEDAKKGLIEPITVRGKKVEVMPPELFLHKDENGVYIPAEQIEGALGFASKDFKVKSSRKSLNAFVKALLSVSPRRIYFGKNTYDDLELSYPKRKDGNRVTILHPKFLAGTKFEFIVDCEDDNIISKEKIKEMLQRAGKVYCIGARRPTFGKFEIISFKETKIS